MILSSFDIFDTTLIRKCGESENIFYLLSQRLFPEDVALREDFILWRIAAENKARARIEAGCEPTLKDIYADCRVEDYAPYTAIELIEAEKQTEAQQLIANPAVRNLIEQKRCEGHTICFISDMYLDSHFLTDVLRREECLKEGEIVYVSCEHKARKSDGALYDVVKSKMHPKKWEHYGDNPQSDVKMARRKGIRAKQIYTAFTDTEKLMISRSSEMQQKYELSILAGFQRAARLSYAGESCYSEIAADFVSPSYIPYVEWVLCDAKRRGLNKLYFLSRDSHILLELAKERAADFPDMELKYFFISRKSLMLPFLGSRGGALLPIAELKERYLSALDNNFVRGQKVDSLLEALGTSRKEMKDVFATTFDYNQIHKGKEEEDFLSKVFSDSSLYLPELRKRIQQCHSTLLEYFRQEGLLEENTLAGMVDIGWLGTSRMMINQILRDQNRSDVHFYYLSIRHDVLSFSIGSYSSFYRPYQLSFYIVGLTALIENYFSVSPYPSTLGYTYSSANTLEPVFKQGEKYNETDITLANRTIASEIMTQMRETDLDFSSVLWDWSRLSLKAISTLRPRIDLTAFARAAHFDSTPFVRRLNLVELLRICCLGEYITALDHVSLMLTCGRRLYPLLSAMRRASGRLRGMLYRKLR